ncbi:MAG: hypothetical protein QGH51_09805 [Planctomycetota bacterium]|jgi:hypothetical protein|nr:hypothetical protein [Planctomycetota bacterium]MDP6942305.1 hypothetical protein [Planctomycetota bacterium]
MGLLPGDPFLTLEGIEEARSDTGSCFTAASWHGLLDSEGSSILAEKSKEVIQRLQALGGKVLILPAPEFPSEEATGRGDKLLQRLREDGNLDGDEAIEELLAQASTGLQAERQLEELARLIHGLSHTWPGLSIALAPSASPASLLSVGSYQLLQAELDHPSVGLWLDLGAIQTRSALGLETVGDWLQCQSQKILGVSLQDFAEGQDQLLPGEGNADFRLVAEYLPSSARRVLQVAPAYPREALQEALGVLESAGIQ